MNKQDVQESVNLDVLGEPVEITTKLYLPKKLFEFGRELFQIENWHNDVDFPTAVNIELIQQLLTWLDQGWGHQYDIHERLVKKTGLDEKTIEQLNSGSWRKAREYLQSIRKTEA